MRLRTFLSYVAIGAVLGVVMLATNTDPWMQSRQPADTPSYRNSERTAYINQIASALEQYHKDHGAFPTTISLQPAQICTSSGADCTSKNLVDLSFLTTAGDYITGIPQDPFGGHGLWGSGFYISSQPGGNLLITAPEAELGKTIQATVNL